MSERVFSKRTSWIRTENALTQARARAHVRAQGMGPILDLTASNPTILHLGYDVERIKSSLSSPNALTYDPAPLGELEARRAIAQYYARRGVAVSPARIMLVATTSEAYTFLFRLLADPGDLVLTPCPSYPLFPFLADLSDVRLEPYHLSYDPSHDTPRWQLDLPSLRRASRPRAIVTVSPNNPTGSILSDSERTTLTTHAVSVDAAILSDEVFADFGHAGRSFSDATFIGRSKALTFSLSGLSKVAGLPQAKLSWIVVSGPEDLANEAIARLEMIGDTHLSVSTQVQLATPGLLAGAEPWQANLRTRIANNLEAVSAVLEGSRLRQRASDGGWYAMISAPHKEDDEEWAIELLEHERVYVHPGYLFDVPGESCVIVSLIVEEETFREGMLRLARHADSRADLGRLG